MKLLWNVLRGRARRQVATAEELVQAARGHLERGDAVAAQLACEQALSRDPRSADALHLLGLVAHGRRDAAGALARLRSAVELDPDNADLRNNLGAVLTHAGRAEEAEVELRRALALEPAHADAWDNLLFLLPSLEGMTGERLRAEHVAWAKARASTIVPKLRHDNSREPERRLRIGYVSPDFRDHAVSVFMEPVIASHDRRAVEVFCYSNNRSEDAVTARLRTASDHWRNIAALDDDEAAAAITADGIDVLVDLTGHLRGNRALVFARKPAPVQIAYLGYPCTTGIPAMDYRVTDRLCDPPGLTEPHYTERLLRLPGCMWCYYPMPGMPEIAPLPARQGELTFASTNNPAKVTRAMLALWARILSGVPRSRLLVAGTPEPGRGRIESELSRQGVAPERLEFVDRVTHAEFWDLHGRIDILLDTYPFNGGTTTCEALWLGVVPVTLAGGHMPARGGATLLGHLGLSDLVVGSPEEYVGIALGLARDLDRLASLRAGMRARMRDAGLVNGAGFTQGLEALYRDAWREWCTSPA